MTCLMVWELRSWFNASIITHRFVYFLDTWITISMDSNNLANKSETYVAIYHDGHATLFLCQICFTNLFIGNFGGERQQLHQWRLTSASLGKHTTKYINGKRWVRPTPTPASHSITST